LLELSEAMREMYSRQIMIKDIGEVGQHKLAAASVLVVGCGGLGAPVISYLTAMGVGHLGLCDGDKVALSNLNRQLLFGMSDVGKPKALTAQKRTLALNPNLKTTTYSQFIDKKDAEKIIPSYDLVIDCLDNFTTRFILNDVCLEYNKPLIHAGVGEFCGQLMTIIPGKGPCLRCLFPKGIEEKEKKLFGVIGPTPGIMGTLQALEAAKYFLGLPISNDELIAYDGLRMTLEKVPIHPNPNCICRKL